MKFRSDEWYLYHYFRNEDPLIPLILWSCFLLICKPGIMISGLFLTWYFYFSWCKKNNEKLNHDPDVLKARQAYKELREKGIIK